MPFMTDAEAITAVKNGRRAETETSLLSAVDREALPTCAHRWRVVACDFETDVIECEKCGWQRLAAAGEVQL